jgi:hypothetical protein
MARPFLANATIFKIRKEVKRRHLQVGLSKYGRPGCYFTQAANNYVFSRSLAK